MSHKPAHVDPRFASHDIDTVRVFDTTLRDGEQTPDTSFSLEDKVTIAEKLDELGVDVIEAGFPVNSSEERQAVEEIAATVSTDVCGLARVVKQDVDAALATDVDMVHTFVSTSDIQIEKSLNSSREEVLAMTEAAVERIAAHDVECMFSPMDATRTDFEYLSEVVQTAADAGADIINVPDTVGVARPTMFNRLLSALVEVVDVPFDVHTHDDFGLAVANALAGIEAGAVQAQVSVNGIGERAGNASLEEFVMSLECIYDADTGIDTEELYEVSKLVERLSDVPLPANKPIVGANAFSHESGIHAAGVLEDTATFEPGIITPEQVGHRRRLVIGKHTGTHSVREALTDAGFDPTDQEVREITKRVKSLGGKGKQVTDADLFAIAESVMESVPSGDRAIDLEDVSVLSGIETTPMATIRAAVNGEVQTDAATGVGPVDAAMNAVASIVDPESAYDVTDFHIDAVTGGSNAVGTVRVGISDAEGLEATARASSEDITAASVEALVEAINHLERKRRSTA
jgi:2-isopropylmalate synthase